LKLYLADEQKEEWEVEEVSFITSRRPNPSGGNERYEEVLL
jgi:hypothetical protein